MQNITRYKSSLFAFLGGLLYASGFPLFNGMTFILGPLLGFTLWIYSLHLEASLKKQIFVSFLFSLGFYLLGFYWIPQTLSEFGGLFFPINQLLGLTFSLVIIPQVYFFTVLRRKISNEFVLAYLFVLLEEFIPQQFPAHIGHSFLWFTKYMSLNLAPIFGASIFSYITALLGLSLVKHLKEKRIPVLNYSLIAVILGFNFLTITQTLQKNLPPLNVRVIQANIGNFLKIDSEKGGTNSLRSIFQNYFELSTKPAQKPIDLIIWPETSFPTLFTTDLLIKNPNIPIPQLLGDIIDRTGAELFIGGYDLKFSTGNENYQDQYNAAFHFSKDKFFKSVYRKMKLIPFGEGLPFGPLNKMLSQYITNISYFAEGDQYTLFKTENGIHFSSAICYEILFSNFIRQYLNANDIQPQFLINLTNDSWYGNTAELEQHLFLAKWRALEFNIPIIRSTNTGITTIITPEGKEKGRIGFNEFNTLDTELLLKERTKTLYQKYGLWLISILALVYLGIDFLYKKAISKL